MSTYVVRRCKEVLFRRNARTASDIFPTETFDSEKEIFGNNPHQPKYGENQKKGYETISGIWRKLILNCVPGTSGQAKNFITRSQAVRKLQISLPDFRRLCIFKGMNYHADIILRLEGTDESPLQVSIPVNLGIRKRLQNPPPRAQRFTTLGTFNTCFMSHCSRNSGNRRHSRRRSPGLWGAAKSEMRRD